MIKEAKKYAIKCHESTNHLYNDKPYSVHLEMTYVYGLKFDYLLDENEWEIALAACWCHDIIEDTRQTYNDVKNICGKEVAEIVYACTNEKGKNRKERANDKYYEGIKSNPLATFVKLCDRLSNIKFSIDTNSKMLDCYRKEHKHFKEKLYYEKFKIMFDEIENLLNLNI